MEMEGVAGSIVILQVVLFVGFVLFGLVSLVFWVWMLVDCLKNEDAEGNDKLIWILVIILTNWIGALIYFCVRRPERARGRLPRGRPPSLRR